VPADFGLVAMATSVIALIELMSAFSLEVGLIQRSNPTREHYDTTWTLRFLFGAAVAASTAALAYPAAGFYADERIAPLLFALAANILIAGFENIGVVDFRRDLDFRREFIFMMSKRFAAMPVSLTLAILFHTYWALVLGVIAGTLVSVVFSYVMHAHRPRFSLARSRELMAFSVWLFFLNLLSFVQSRLSHFIIGRVHGPAALGVFTVSTDISALASSEITAPINRAVMPGLSRMGEQSEDGIGRGLLRVTSIVLIVTMPAAFGMAAVAEPLVLTLLGGQWLPAVPVVQILAFAGGLQSITANNHSAYLAAAKLHVVAIIASAFAIVLVPLLFVFLRFGAVGVAVANLGATVVAVALSVAMARWHFGTTFSALARVAWRPLVGAAVMGAAVHWLDLHNFGWHSRPPAVPRLLIGVAAGVAVYVPLVLLLWLASGRESGAERFLLDRLRSALRR
jgi:PST family polysaccharide transporter